MKNNISWFHIDTCHMEPTTAQPTTNFSHFVTFTLKPELYGKSCRQQLRVTFKKACYELERVCKSYKLVAELTKKCNVHYHALVEFDVNIHFSSDDLSMILQDNVKSSNVFGRSESEPIKNHDATVGYLSKDIQKTAKIINPRGKTPLDYTKDWTKGLIKIEDVKATRLKDYLKIDNGIEYDSEEIITGMDGLLKQVLIKNGKIIKYK